MHQLSPRQTWVSIVLAGAILLFIVQLVVRRKLRVEYSWFWLCIGVGTLLLTLRVDLLVKLTKLIGGLQAPSTLFFFALLFLMFVSIHYSIKISTLHGQLKNLTQKVALLEAEIEEAEIEGAEIGERGGGEVGSAS